jgi:hypothetical protein
MGVGSWTIRKREGEGEGGQKEDGTELRKEQEEKGKGLRGDKTSLDTKITKVD